jgi:hypothetical protein
LKDIQGIKYKQNASCALPLSFYSIIFYFSLASSLLLLLDLSKYRSSSPQWFSAIEGTQVGVPDIYF